jgi:hypothetical protein
VQLPSLLPGRLSTALLRCRLPAPAAVDTSGSHTVSRHEFADFIFHLANADLRSQGLPSAQQVLHVGGSYLAAPLLWLQAEGRGCTAAGTPALAEGRGCTAAGTLGSLLQASQAQRY